MAGVLKDAADCTERNLLPEQSSHSFLFKLREQVKKSSGEMINFILDYYSDFLPLLKDKDSEKESMYLAVTALGRACSNESSLRKYLNRLMATISTDMNYIVINMQRHLVSLHKLETLEPHHLDALLNLSLFLKTFQLTLPSSSLDSVSILLPLMRDTCEKLLKQHVEFYKEVSENLKLVAEEQEYFIQHHSLYDEKKLSESEKIHMLEPPQDFRSLSILPTFDDVSLPCLFLRPNITKGRYNDTEHYLDVQFRLLREDYIKPLRDGIAEYLTAKKNKLPLRNIESNRVYTNVFIKSEELVDCYVMHEIQFTEKYLSEIDWKVSKRLLTGNLLCLSTDNFYSILFATIVKRDPVKLKKGLLLVKFENMNETLQNLNFSNTFVVIEVPALFESYRHNLKALQHLNEESLPMKSYIVDLENSQSEPFYLLSSTAYDMRPLFFPLKEGCIGLQFLSFVRKNSDLVHDKYKSVKVLDDSEWPTASEINLDESQYLALKSAVTKEFAIIQGPPGTGKTYIGLRAAQLLLHNINNWYNYDPRTLPILVVCYTNHALDQFLEGILMLTNKIVRIGGRGSNEKINCYQIKNLIRHFKTIPYDIRNRIYEAKCNVECLRRQVQNFVRFLETPNTVLSENILKHAISQDHFYSLKNHGDLVSDERSSSNEKIYDWLEINYFNDPSLEDNSDEENFMEFQSGEVREHLRDEAEANIELIENQRNIDCYDFTDRLVLRASCLNSREQKEQKTEEYIINSLQINPVMQKDRASSVKDIWSLPINERWQLYKFWVEQFQENKRQNYFDLKKKLEYAVKELADARNAEDLYVIRNTYIIGMTTTGAAKYRHIIEARNPVVLIVEEAAEVLECHIIASLAPKTQHVILIGDQQQLRPSPSVHMLAVKYGMDVSLFERMINNGIDYFRLSLQHRMRPEIAALIVPHIYKNLKNHETVTKFENIKGVVKNVFFVNHSFNELHIKDSKSKVNDYEASFIVKLCKYLILQGYDPSVITVLTTYSGQLMALKRLATDDDVKKVRFTVVDNFQGEENDIVLISFVRSNDNGEIGFLKVFNRICVALSRAKKGLYCIGNFTLFEQKSNLWRNIIQTLNENQSIGPCLRLVCQNHPDMFNEVANATHFKAVPEGGCSRRCEYRLPCGHSCSRICHIDDADHKHFRCEKPCVTVCERGHQCPEKCYEDCQPCPINVEKTLSECGHTIIAMCGLTEDEIECQEPCKETCASGHACPKKCFEFCGSCMVIVDRLLSRCKHTVKAECGIDEIFIECKEPCNRICENGHPCLKMCFEICGECNVITDRVLSQCNHTVKAECCKREKRIICQEPCKKSCKEGHPCLKMCFEDCGSCMVIIDRRLSRCNHTVKAECGKNEDEIICQEPCKKTCEKGHACTKMCFEDCGSCQVITDRHLSQCNHIAKAECGKKESDILCEEPCTKVCSKGHLCTKKCRKLCVRCEFMVDKKLKRCGHVVKARCSDPELWIKCESKCAKTCSKGHLCQKLCYEKCPEKCVEPCKDILPCGHICKGTCGSCEQGTRHVLCEEEYENLFSCGHKCVKKCSEPCEEQCMKIVPVQSPICKHLVNIECSFSNISNNLSMKCLEPCDTVLPCGHTCKGTCGSCYQGRLHVACYETCNKILICGHKCASECCKSCPPCEKPCKSECSHGKCFGKCGYPCVNCTKPCAWFCSHKKCTRLCYEVCDRDPCNERCLKQLPCNHQCIGFCGEPCPKECIICDRNILTENLSDLKNRTISGYVYLEDCKHGFKQDYLDEWFTSNVSEMQRICLKTCPKCKTVVRRNFRFNKIIKNAARNIEKIKQLTKWDKTRNLYIQRNVLEQANLLHSNLSILYKQGIKLLSGGNVRNIHELTNLENTLRIAKEIEFKSYNICSMFVSRSFHETLINYARYCREWLTDFISKNFIVISEYQLKQLSGEVHRLQLLDFLLKFAELNHFASLSPEFEKCSASLMTFSPFTDASIERFKKCIEIFLRNSKDVPLTYDQPLNVISMSGSWYQCSEGHTICISKCDENIVTSCYRCEESTTSNISTMQPSNTNFYSKNNSMLYNCTSFKDSRKMGEADCPVNKARLPVLTTRSATANNLFMLTDEDVSNLNSKYPTLIMRSPNTYKKPDTLHQSESECKSNILPNWRNKDFDPGITFRRKTDRFRDYRRASGSVNQVTSAKYNDSSSKRLSGKERQSNILTNGRKEKGDSEKGVRKNNDKHTNYGHVSRSPNQVHFAADDENQFPDLSSVNQHDYSGGMERQLAVSSTPLFSGSGSRSYRDAVVPKQNYRKINADFEEQSSKPHSGGKEISRPSSSQCAREREAKNSNDTPKEQSPNKTFSQGSKKKEQKMLHGRNPNDLPSEEHSAWGQGSWYRKQ